MGGYETGRCRLSNKKRSGKENAYSIILSCIPGPNSVRRETRNTGGFMPKRIVYCADGTWQTPRNATNVYLLYKALTMTADQITFYDDGVGSDGTCCDQVFGGLIGDGLIEKILQSYTKIAHVYEPGDELYLFGFSRGAYTARSLGGFIATCGLPTGKFDDSCVAKAFTAYRDPVNRAAILAGLTGCGLGDATIRMIGAWDTVGSLGIPALFGGIDEQKYGFLDTKLHPDVKNAFHCMAIDEHRAQFPATLWTSEPAPGQTLEQVWFTGCHCDIGGGTPIGVGVDKGTRLCDITLGWMMGKAQALGLVMDPGIAAKYGTLPAEYALDAYTDSWTGKPLGPPKPRPIATDAHLANSVAVRVQYALTYAPPNLSIQDRQLAEGYAFVNVVDEEVI